MRQSAGSNSVCNGERRGASPRVHTISIGNYNGNPRPGFLSGSSAVANPKLNKSVAALRDDGGPFKANGSEGCDVQRGEASSDEDYD